MFPEIEFPTELGAIFGFYGGLYQKSAWQLHGYLAHTKEPPPQDYHRALGRGLL